MTIITFISRTKPECLQMAFKLPDRDFMQRQEIWQAVSLVFIMGPQVIEWLQTCIQDSKNPVSTGNCQGRFSRLGEVNLFQKTKSELKMVVDSFGSCNVMESSEFLNFSEEGFTSSITRSPTGYWNPLVAPDRLPKLLSRPYRQYKLTGNRNLQKIFNLNYYIEDTCTNMMGLQWCCRSKKLPLTHSAVCVMKIKTIAKISLYKDRFKTPEISMATTKCY